MRPLPSITSASAGIGTSFPIAAMMPCAMTTVALSIGGPETGTTLAPRIAKYSGSPPCAQICGAAASRTSSVAPSASTNEDLRVKTDIVQAPFWEMKEDTIPRPSKKQTHEANGKFQESQEPAVRFQFPVSSFQSSVLSLQFPVSYFAFRISVFPFSDFLPPSYFCLRGGGKLVPCHVHIVRSARNEAD